MDAPPPPPESNDIPESRASDVDNTMNGASSPATMLTNPPMEMERKELLSTTSLQPDQNMVVMQSGIIPSWALDMNIDKLSDSTELFGQMEQLRKQCIYRVPEWIKELSNSQAYEPQVVSLGPFHYGNPKLWPMEVHKLRAVMNMVWRTGKPLEQFIAAVGEVAPLLESAYGRDLDNKWKTDQDRRAFVDLMVRDGCFFLEVMRWNEAMATSDSMATFDPNDTVFNEHGFIHYQFRPIQTDMLLMENQLPLLLLKTLASVVVESQIHDGWMNCSVLQCLWRTDVDYEARYAIGDDLGLHPLDLYHKSYCHFRRGGYPPAPVLLRTKPVMPSAVELYEAGINFKVTKLKTLPDINFEGGVLSIPAYTVDYFSEKVLLNLMALERLHAGTGDSITAYVIFMDNIIDTAKDVALLREEGILVNGLGSDEEIADLFNNRLSKGAAMSLSSTLNDVHDNVNAHCRKRWNRWHANLKHTYFNNPWAFISFIAASILLVATLLQTTYSVVAYHLPPHS